MSKGILYVMSTVVNGLIKIGKTGSNCFESRMYTLERNGYANVAGLKRVFAIEVEDYDEKEALIDTIFSKSQVPGTELFALDVNLVVQLLSSFEGTIVYPKETKEKAFDDATDKMRRSVLPAAPAVKKSAFHFSSVGVPIGAKLTYVKDPSVAVVVVDDSRVSYQGKQWSMTALAKSLANTDKPVQGPAMFKYNGVRLSDLKKKVEANVEEN